MKHLLRVEWLIGRFWILFGVGLFVVLMICLVFESSDGGSGLEMGLSLVPFIVTFIVASRSMITMDQDEIVRGYKLLPVPAGIVVGSKYIFVNAIYIILLILTVLLKMVVLDDLIFSGSMGNMQFLWFAIGMILVNFTLFGYYLLGAKNIQVIMTAGTFLLLLGSKYFGYFGDIQNSLLNVIATTAAIVISLLFYFLSCRIFSTDVLEHLSFLFRGVVFKRLKI